MVYLWRLLTLMVLPWTRGVSFVAYYQYEEMDKIQSQVGDEEAMEEDERD